MLQKQPSPDFKEKAYDKTGNKRENANKQQQQQQQQ
jgi:hypothetical protein